MVTKNEASKETLQFLEAVSGGNTQIEDNATVLLADPDGGSFAHTLIFPPNPTNGQVLKLACTPNGDFNPVTLDGGTKTISEPLAVLSNAASRQWVYVQSVQTWYKL
jgi:hypothetical protein